MKTRWGELAVSDAHLHFLSHRFYAGLARQAGAPVSAALAEIGIEEPEPDPIALAARWVKELDTHGIESSVLIASIAGDEASVGGAVAAFPSRFFGYFLVDPTQEDAVRSVTEALDAGLQGICLFPAMHRFAMHDHRVTAILEAIDARTGVVVFVHCGVLSVGVRSKLGLPSRFDMRFSNPIDVHGVALRFPQLTFVIPHFGAGYFREALMVADMCPNVCFDTSSSNDWVKYQSPGIGIRDAFSRALDVVGPQRLLFGSDSSFFPRGWVKAIFQTQATLLFDLGVDAHDAQLIFGANLRRILARNRE